MKRWIFLILAAIIVVALLIGGCTPSEPSPVPSTPSTPSQTETPSTPETIELTYESNYSPPHPYALAAEDAIARLEQETNGRVNITAHWGGTILTARERRSELGAGVVDIALAPLESPQGTEVNFYFGNFGLLLEDSSPEFAMDVGMELCNSFPTIYEELRQLNTVNLGLGNTEPRVLISRKPVNSLDDLQGMMIRAKGYEDLIDPFGASTVDLPAPDVYMALEKGTVDAAFLPYETLKSLRFAEVAKYVNMDIFAAFPGFPMSLMNLDSYNSLPSDIQTIFIDNIPYWNDAVLNHFKENTATAKAFAEEQNVEHLTLSAADKATWHNASVKACDKYISILNDAGKPGNEFAEEMQRIAAELSK